MIREDFPKNELEFHAKFADEESCRQYWCEMRWPEGFICPHCGHKGGWRRKGREEWVCAGRTCGKETSMRSGTVLHNSPKPIRTWLVAMFHMSVNKQSISGLRLQKLLGFGSYDTALRWLRELRRVLAPTEASGKLGPEVEVDETFIGGVQAGTKGPFKGKKLVLGVVEKKGRAFGRVRMRLIPTRSAAILTDFVKEFVEEGSIVSTDGYLGYLPLAEMGFVHDPRVTTNGRGGNSSQIKLEDGQKAVDIHLPMIHRVFDKFSRVIAGAHQGTVSEKHIQLYLDEYCFRFNRKDSKKPLAIFQTIVSRAVASAPIPLWKSRGRIAADIPSKTMSKDWCRLANAVAGLAYLG